MKTMATVEICNKLIILLGIQLEAGVIQVNDSESRLRKLLDNGEYHLLNPIELPVVEVYQLKTSTRDLQTHIRIGDGKVVRSICFYRANP